MERNRKRYHWMKLTFAILSLGCSATLVILLILESRTLTFEDPSSLEIGIYIVSGLMIGVLTIFSVMGVKEYVSHFRGLRDDSFHKHRLTFSQVIDNVLRKRIVEIILDEPGIHYNLLRKKCFLQPGQFRWHIEILLNYNIIRKQKIGQYVVFFPSISEETQNLDLTLKYPLRDEIYQMIFDNPGIISSDIARKLDIPNQRNKVKYHVDKLISAKFIIVVQKGRKRELYSSHSSRV